MYYIDKRFSGTTEHITACNTAESIYNLVENGTTEPGSLQSFLRVLGTSRELIPENIKRACETCGIPIELASLKSMLRDDDFSSLVAEFNDDISSIIHPAQEYIPFYIKNISTLNGCSPMRFSSDVVDTDHNGFAQQVVYDTTSTKTGRMSVVAGPNVLTLQKTFKNDLVSRFPGGVIAEVDYSALEPRVALAIAGSDMATAEDIYTEIGDMLGITERNVAKQLVISFLYGAGMAAMCKLTGLPSSTLSSRLAELKNVFGHAKTVKMLKEQLVQDGYFKNHAGRVIFPGTDRPGVLFNNYCQSSAVDVALSGFATFIERLSENNCKAVPLCFIHDAMLIDLPAEELDLVMQLSANLHTYLKIDFPTKFIVLGD